MLKQSFPPLIEGRPTVLILGSLPGEESLRQRQYYAYPHNVFWRIMAEVFGFDRELDYAARCRELTARGVAVWDTVGAGRRSGSLDSDLRAERLNDIAGLVGQYPSIRGIGCNGATAYANLRKGFPELFASHPAIVRLPSTSPAAAGIPYPAKLAAWREFLQEEMGR